MHAHGQDPVVKLTMPDLTAAKLTEAEPTSPKLTGVCWQKSRCSNSQGACVELAGLPDGDIAIRNSRDPNGPVLFYTKAEIRALIEGVKEGDFDNLLRLVRVSPEGTPRKREDRFAIFRSEGTLRTG